MGHCATDAEFVSLKIAVLTVSDSRTEETDTSGQTLKERATKAGHEIVEKRIVIDDVYQLRSVVSQWIADDGVQVILVNGGTGLTGRDVTPQALTPLLDKHVPGFGELFRQVSFEEIKTSTVQSRAFAGLANGTLIFCLPGSPGGVRCAWDRILEAQLDNRTRPCNFIALLPRFMET